MNCFAFGERDRGGPQWRFGRFGKDRNLLTELFRLLQKITQVNRGRRCCTLDTGKYLLSRAGHGCPGFHSRKLAHHTRNMPKLKGQTDQCTGDNRRINTDEILPLKQAARGAHVLRSCIHWSVCRGLGHSLGHTARIAFLGNRNHARGNKSRAGQKQYTGL